MSSVKYCRIDSLPARFTVQIDVENRMINLVDRKDPYQMSWIRNGKVW